MNILIAGGNGFLGNAISHDLKKNKYNVFIINRKSGQFCFNYSDKDSKCPLFKIKFDLLINCAFDYSERIYSKKNVNIIIVKKLLRLCEVNNIACFLNISSINVSNGTDYGFLKKKIENIVARFSNGYSMRLGLIYIKNNNRLISKLQNFNRLIPFVQFSLGYKNIPVHTSSFDKISKTIYLLLNDRVHKRIFNVIDNKVYNFNDLIYVDKLSINFKIPIKLIIFFMNLYEFLNLPKTSFNSDSLKNILTFKKYESHKFND